MMENLDSSIACRSSEDICWPLLRWSSMKVFFPYRLSEACAGSFTSETKEDILLPWMMGGRERN